MSELKKIDRLPDELPADPMPIAAAWLAEAADLAVRRNPNAMTLVSVSASGHPSARIILCKEFIVDPGYLVFYTNYRSRKALEFMANRNAAALFHWDSLGRQIRIEGTVVRSPEKESDDYFASRAVGSQLGAWGSDQSSPISSRDALAGQILQRGGELGLSFADGLQVIAENDAPTIDRPPHWGGYRLWAESVELWIEGRDRIHDRGFWSRSIAWAKDECVDMAPWTSTRLQP